MDTGKIALKIDYGSMIGAVQDESNRHGEESTGYLNRNTGEIHFIWQRYRDLIGFHGENYEDVAVQDAQVLSAPNDWIEIERSVDISYRGDSESHTQELEEYAHEFLRKHGIVAELK